MKMLGGTAGVGKSPTPLGDAQGPCGPSGGRQKL